MASRGKHFIPDPRRIRTQRASLYWTLGAAILGFVVAVTQGAMSPVLALIWVLVFLLVVVAYEGFVHRGIQGEAVCLFGSSYAELEHKMPESVATLISASGATGVSILGGTLGTFAKVGANLTALANLYRDGHPVRILVLDPDGSGIRQLAEQRQQRGHDDTVEDLAAEIRRGLKRLHAQLGRTAMLDCCRLYQHLPRNSVYCLGPAYVVTIYRFGAGASSPCIFLRESDATAAFCDALEHTFDDIWNARSTRTFRLADVGDAEVTPPVAPVE